MSILKSSRSGSRERKSPWWPPREDACRLEPSFLFDLYFHKMLMRSIPVSIYMVIHSCEDENSFQLYWLWWWNMFIFIKLFLFSCLFFSYILYTLYFILFFILIQILSALLSTNMYYLNWPGCNRKQTAASLRPLYSSRLNITMVAFVSPGTSTINSHFLCGLLCFSFLAGYWHKYLITDSVFLLLQTSSYCMGHNTGT